MERWVGGPQTDYFEKWCAVQERAPDSGVRRLPTSSSQRRRLNRPSLPSRLARVPKGRGPDGRRRPMPTPHRASACCRRTLAPPTEPAVERVGQRWRLAVSRLAPQFFSRTPSAGPPSRPPVSTASYRPGLHALDHLRARGTRAARLTRRTRCRRGPRGQRCPSALDGRTRTIHLSTASSRSA